MALTFRPIQPLDLAAVLPAALIEQQLKNDPAGDESALIDAFARTACGWVEGRTSTSLSSRSWVVTFSSFEPMLRLPVGPIQAVTAIAYRDASNASQSVAAGGWYLEGANLAPAPGTLWPVGASAVAVSITAGFSVVGTEAPHLVAAATMLLAHLWRNREGQTEPGTFDAPRGVIALCDLLRTPVIG